MKSFESWVEYARQILVLAGHGYDSYCRVDIPPRKLGEVGRIEAKLCRKYPVEASKDQRYRARKQRLANFAFLRWQSCGILLCTPGQMPDLEDKDRFLALRERPYEFQVGEWIAIKIGPAKTGKKYTAYLTKSSFRDLKAVLCEKADHRHFEALMAYYLRLEGLPAFSGILGQVEELSSFLRRTYKLKLPRLRLRSISPRDRKRAQRAPLPA